MAKRTRRAPGRLPEVDEQADELITGALKAAGVSLPPLELAVRTRVAELQTLCGLLPGVFAGAERSREELKRRLLGRGETAALNVPRPAEHDHDGVMTPELYAALLFSSALVAEDAVELERLEKAVEAVQEDSVWLDGLYRAAKRQAKTGRSRELLAELRLLEPLYKEPVR